ncbi:MAG: branched-chain amino acid ABC transporter permease [Thermoleophilaceae bacterium]|nr:branched-chain amino acid ABC transporter permease [Thermoleophilaceae bacterium]
MSWFQDLLPLIFIYAMLAVSLSLLLGHTGVFSMAHAALFGVGAYTYGVLTVKHGVPLLLACLAAVVACALVSALIAAPSLRVSGDYFVVASLGAQVVISDVLSNWDGVTGGPAGLPGILRPVIAGVDFSSDDSFLLLVAVISCLTVAVCAWVVRSPFGRTLHALRDDELAAAAMGKPTRRVKIIVATFAGGVAGLAGVLYSQYFFFLSPDTFVLSNSITVITMVVIGGMYTVTGSALGAAVILLLPELLKELDLEPSTAAALQQMIFGALLIAFMFVRPRGIFGGVTEIARRVRAGQGSQTKGGSVADA